LGAAIDVSSSHSAERELSYAADAAALVGARDLDLKKSEREQVALDYFRSNSSHLGKTYSASASVEILDDGARVTVEGKKDTTLLQLVGVDSLPLKVVAEARSGGVTIEPHPIEIVLVMDTTQSMRSISKSWDDAVKVVAETFDMLVGEDDASSKSGKDKTNPKDEVFISFVPLGDRINVGTDKTKWIKGSAPKNWNGCLEPREEKIGSLQYALSDTKPTGKNKFEASIPGKTGGLSKFGSGYPHCPAKITGPTNDIDTLKKAVAGIWPAGTGRFDEGLAWAWRLVSPEWHGRWDAPNYPNKKDERRKVIVIVTDSYSTAYDHEVGAKGGVPWNQISDRGFTHIEDLCSRIKEDGIEIHVLLFNSYERAKGPWSRCASEDSFFEIGNIDDFRVGLERAATNPKSSGQLRLTL
jgi:hypothetical protein